LNKDKISNTKRQFFAGGRQSEAVLYRKDWVWSNESLAVKDNRPCAPGRQPEIPALGRRLLSGAGYVRRAWRHACL